MEPYKYAGYPMLIKTIRMETQDSNLFSKKTPLLPAASELAFHTINCSALNVEELRRENGIEVGSIRAQVFFDMWFDSLGGFLMSCVSYKFLMSN